LWSWISLSELTQTFFNLRKILNMNKLSAFIFGAFIATCAAVPAIAQDKAPTPAPAAAAPAPVAAPAPSAAPINVPKHSCVKPEVAGKPKTNDELKVLNANLATYRECLTAYSTEMRRYADAHIEAGNVSVEEYNEFIKVVREKTK
jgi:hypothetical protein